MTQPEQEALSPARSPPAFGRCPERENSQPLLTVIIPVYNEARTIDEILARVLAASLSPALSQTEREPDILSRPAFGRRPERDKEGMQIIVVDDASTDGTAAKLERWRHLVTTLTHFTNRGKGAAIRTGLEHAAGYYTLIQDADLEYDPRDYQRLLAPLLAGEADVVYGSRYMGTNVARSSNDCTTPERHRGRSLQTPERHPPRRASCGRSLQSIDDKWTMGRFGVWLLNHIVQWLYGVRLTDEATCYKVFRTGDLRAMDLQCERFEFCPEVTAKACRMGLRIVEVPISYTPRSAADGKKIRWRDGWSAAKTLWRWRSWQAPNLHRRVLNGRPSLAVSTSPITAAQS